MATRNARATEIVVTVETPEIQSPPPSSDHRETAPVTALVELAAAVGSLSAQVETLTEQTTEATETAEQAQRSATLAVDLAISSPTPTPEPEPETGSVGGDAGGSPARRKRGRPRKDASGNEGVAGTVSVRVKREPKTVGLAALGLGGDTGGVKFKDAYSGGAKLLFAIPKYSGLGEHWSLDDDEADDLGQAIHAFVKTLPASARKKWEKRLEKYFPRSIWPSSLGCSPCRAQWRRWSLLKYKRAQLAAQHAAKLSPDTPYGSASPDAGTRPAAYDLRDVVDRHAPGLTETDATVRAGGAGENGIVD
jgi:hypothetical protein